MSAELARVEFSAEQVALIKRTICQGATDDELELFLAQCRRTGLDPFARQIHAVKRYDRKQGREVMSIQIGIDGFRLIGERTARYGGQDGPYWCGEDGVWRDVWTSNRPPVAAKVLVFRSGCERPFVGIAHWGEYAQTNRDGHLIPMWKQMPAGQLAKCAEALGLRKAFPLELSGLYAPEEMDQASGGGYSTNDEPKPSVKQLPPPLTKDAFHALLLRKGFSWSAALSAIDSKKKTTYAAAQAPYEAVLPDHVSSYARWLERQPDKPAAPAQPDPDDASGDEPSVELDEDGNPILFGNSNPVGVPH